VEGACKHPSSDAERDGFIHERRGIGILRSWAFALRGSEKCTLRGNSRLPLKPARAWLGINAHLAYRLEVSKLVG